MGGDCNIMGTFSGGGGGGVTTNSITTTVTSSFSTTSTSFVAVTGMTLTLSDESNGLAFVHVSGCWENTVADNNCQANISNDGTEISSSTVAFSGRAVGRYMNSLNLSANVSTDGSVVALYARAAAETCNFNFGANAEGQIKAFEVY